MAMTVSNGKVSMLSRVRGRRGAAAAARGASGTGSGAGSDTDLMVEITGVEKSFPAAGKRPPLKVLQDVNMSARPGEFLSVVGPSGCGKTTLLRMIAGLGRQDTGEIRVAGRSIEGPSADTGFVFQRYSLLPWRTVVQNVELALEIRRVSKSERRRRALEVIEQLGLAGFEDYYPSQLSGGMQQRVGLGRALSKNPSVLLMDEPFAALDFHTRERLQRELSSMWEQFLTTVVFVTHSIEEAIFLADRVVVMASHPGRVVGEVTVDLPRPRADHDVRRTPEFAELGGVIRDMLMQNDPMLRADAETAAGPAGPAAEASS